MTTTKSDKEIRSFLRDEFYGMPVPVNHIPETKNQIRQKVSSFFGINYHEVFIRISEGRHLYIQVP